MPFPGGYDPNGPRVNDPSRIEALEAEVERLEGERNLWRAAASRSHGALGDARRRLEGAGMLGGNDEPVVDALDFLDRTQRAALTKEDPDGLG